MAFEQINRGTTANDGTGDNLREAFRKVNDNFDKALEKVTTAGVERVYTINADGSQGTKATSLFNDVIEGYFNGTDFYTDALFTNLITPESGRVYINIAVTPATQYRWSGSAYVRIGGSKRTWILSFTGLLYFDGTSGNGNWSGINATASGTFGLLGGTNGLLFQTPIGSSGLPATLSPARVIPYNCKIKSFHIRNGLSNYSAVNPANFLLRFLTHTPNGTTTLNNPILQGEFNSTGFNMPANYIYPSSCFTNNNLTLQAGDVITPICRGLQALTAGSLITDFYLEFEEI